VLYVLTCSFTPLGSSFKNINPGRREEGRGRKQRRGGVRKEVEERQITIRKCERACV
jgi:hypothetical protein